MLSVSSLRLLFVAACVSMLSLFLPAQARLEVDTQDTIRLTAELVVLDALVFNKKTGRVVGDLTREDFDLFDDGVKQTIAHFSRDVLPLSVVLLFDAEMRGLEYLQPPGASSSEALKRLKPGDEVALMAFDMKGATLIEGLTADRELIAKQLEKLCDSRQVPVRTQGPRIEQRPGTALNEGVFQAAAYLDKNSKPPRRPVIVVATTEMDPVQPPLLKRPKEQVLEQLLEPGITVFGLMRPHYVQLTTLPNPFRLFSRGPLGYFADETGGEIVGGRGQIVGQLLAEAIDRIRTRYTLAFVPSHQEWDGKLHRLKLSLSESAFRREGPLMVRTRRGYYAKRRTDDAVR